MFPRCLGVAALLSLSGEAAAQPFLTVTDSVVLEQGDDAYLTVPTAVVPDADGYLITDAQQPHAFRFTADGRLDRVYGSEGDRPREVREVAVALAFTDDRVLVVSWSPRAAHLFERSTGAFVRSAPLVGPVESVLIDGDRLWISGVDYGTATALRRVGLEGSAVLPVVAIPAAYESGGPLQGIFPEVPFTKWADTLLVAFEPLAELLVVTDRGAVVDRFEVPAAHRRGTPDDPVALLEETLLRRPYHEVFGLFCVLRAVHRRSDGTFLLVHFDSRAETPPVSSEVFVSVLDRGRDRVCLDAPVPLGPDAQPAIGFDGDRLLVVEQVLAGLEVTAVLREVEVTTSGCEWTRVVR